MAIDQVVLAPDTALEILEEIGAIGNWLQALGVVFIIWLVIQIINFFINGKRIQKLNNIQERLANIEAKLKRKSN